MAPDQETGLWRSPGAGRDRPACLLVLCHRRRVIMRPYLAGLLMAALVVLPVRGDDKPAVKEGDSDVSFKQLKKELEQGQNQLKELVQAYQKAKTNEERQEIEKKFNTLQKSLQQARQKLSPKFL